MSNRSRVAEVEVGTPPCGFQRWETARVYFHGFAEMSTEKGDVIESPTFTCLGTPWSLFIYPGGEETSDDGCVTIYLISMASFRIEVDFAITVRDSSDSNVKDCTWTNSFDPDDDDNLWGWKNYAKRSELLEVLSEGTLVVEVRLRNHGRSNDVFIPTNPLRKNILHLFNDEESSDIVFNVSRQGQKPPKRARRDPVYVETKTGRKMVATKTARKSAPLKAQKVHAHRFVLQHSASLLAELCEPGADAKTKCGVTSVQVFTDFDPDAFHNMLFYLYGGDLSEKEFWEWKELISVADKYGLVNLKLEAEARYVQWMEFSIDNILDNLMYADAKNCALLKEAAMDYILENKDEVMEKVSFEDAPGYMMKDLLAAVTRGEKKSDAVTGGRNYNSMRVGYLRKMLDDEGLDVDGSREAMIARLKENDENNAGSDASSEAPENDENND